MPAWHGRIVQAYRYNGEERRRYGTAALPAAVRGKNALQKKRGEARVVSKRNSLSPRSWLLITGPSHPRAVRQQCANAGGAVGR